MTTWEVVAERGVIVRTGQTLSSAPEPDRLAAGAVVKELALVGNRLQYQKVKGDGPAQGWVVTKVADMPMLVKGDELASFKAAPQTATSIKAIHPIDDASALDVGAHVKIKGLKSAKAQDLNGKEGDIVKYDASMGRWAVKVEETGKIVRCLPENLTAMSEQMAPTSGTDLVFGDQAAPIMSMDTQEVAAPPSDQQMKGFMEFDEELSPGYEKLNEVQEGLVSDMRLHKVVGVPSNGSQLITGGAGGLGLLLSLMNIETGSKHIQLVSRRGQVPEESRWYWNQLTRSSATIVMKRADAGNKTHIRECIQDQPWLPPRD